MKPDYRNSPTLRRIEEWKRLEFDKMHTTIWPETSLSDCSAKYEEARAKVQHTWVKIIGDL